MASKVLLVEDDNNLREIYQARLQAEGYDIVSAKDGEEALVIAKQEQPDLIISDVMMPRVSGFEMLDILRNTEGLKDPKVIMLTALGQADDKNRAEELGADRYLVKSQVTLEDIVKAAQDLLTNDDEEEPADVVAAAAAGMTAAEQPAPVEAPAVPASEPTKPIVADTPVVEAPAEPATVTTPVPEAPAAEPAPVEAPAVPAPTPVAPPAAVPVPVVEAPIEPTAVPAPTIPGTSPVVTQPIEASPREDDPNDKLIADALKDLTSDVSTSDSAPAEPATVTTPVPEAPAAEPAPVEAPAVPAPTPVAPPAAVPVPVVEAPIEPTAVPAPTPVANDEDDNDDSSPVAHKKIIRPISDPNAQTRPDINDLLAREEAKNVADVDSTVPLPAPAPAPVGPAPADVQSETPHEPGHVISPSPSAPEAPAAPEQPSPAVDDDMDPNNIAL
jgi:CheY-like chemotaxis protein